jgi:uncharacterized protein YecT (DUF1311 family)
MIGILAVAAAILVVAPGAQAAPKAAPKPAQARTVKPPPSVYDRCLTAPAARSQAGAIACVDQEIQRQSATVERYYAIILKDLAEYEKDREPPERTFATDPMRAAQRAWIAFRDADCRLHASPTWGARAALDARKCLLEHITGRVQELGDDANPVQEPPPDAVVLGPSPCEKKARTGRDMSVCAINDFERADARLNRVYKVFLDALGPDDKDVARAAQRLWIAYRDADCNRLIDDRLWGTGGGYEATVCAEAATSTRADQLEAFLGSHVPGAPR